MIDFRYHLVSIISIFLALAVGIVLGAGPLKGGIGTTLTQELANTRKDKAALNDELLAANKLQTASNAYGAAVLDRVVQGSLTGRRVVVVVGPRAADATVKSVTDVVTRAGGTVTRTVTLSPAFLDTPATTDTGDTSKQAVIDRLATLTRTSDLPDSDVPGAVLGHGIVDGAAGTTPTAPATSTAVVTQLTAAKLVAVSEPTTAVTPTLVVVVAGPLQNDAAQAKVRTDAYLGLVRGLDTVAQGTMLVSDSATATNANAAAKIISAARASNPTSEAVTTVDDADLPMGAAAVALGLVVEGAGTPGRYGVLDDAQAVLPANAATATATPSPGASK